MAGGGTFTNIKAYQYKENGKEDTDDTTECLAKGDQYVGGIIGYDSTLNINTLEVTNSKIIGKTQSVGGIVGYWIGGSCNVITSIDNEVEAENAKYVGGCIGYGVNTINQCLSSSNVINGNQYVGGCVGYVSGGIDTMTSEKNNIEGTEYVGGCVGYVGTSGTINKISSIDNVNIEGTEYVGGCIGLSQAIIRNAKTFYTNKEVSPNILGTNYVGGIVGQEQYNLNTTSVGNYSIQGAYSYNVNIHGDNYVGGISGDSVGHIYAAAVDNATIVANTNYAGGIAGFYQGTKEQNASKLASGNFGIMHSFCTNSDIKAKNMSGGITGGFVYGNIQYCYVGNSSITGDNIAGGLVGYLDNSKMDDRQYRVSIKWNYVANSDSQHILKGNKSVGGLIGMMEFGISPGYIESNLIATNIITQDVTKSSMVIGDVGSKTDFENYQYCNMDGIYIYENSKINDEKIVANEEFYTLLSVEDLSNEITYSSIENLNFGNTRYGYNENYFPSLKILTESSNQTYWDESNLNVNQPKIELPAEEEKISLMIADELQILPEVYTYAVDVDKINIEFSEVGNDVYFDVKTQDGNIVVEKTNIAEKVYTLQYDFNTPLTISISNLNNWNTNDIEAKTVKNIIDIIDDEYLYITDDHIYSSNRDIEGKYVNMYNGLAMNINGEIYNLKDMQLTGNNNEIKLLDENKPIAESIYGENIVKTYYHTSKIIKNDDDKKYVYKDKQIFMKNNNIYLADSNLSVKGDSVIIDSYNDKKYETILGTDGRLYNLMSKIKYPSGFKNKNIVSITNNINNDRNIVLVYYDNGKVCAFNYITGEEVYNNNVKEKISLIDYIKENLNFEKLLYDIEEKGYEEANEFAQKLEYISIDEAKNNITNNNYNDSNDNNISNDKENDTITDNIEYTENNENLRK